MMLKRLIPIILSLCILAGCSSREAAAVDIQPDEAAQTIMEQVEFRDTLVKAEGGAENSRYNLDDSIVADYAIYVSGSGATAEEIAVLKLADGASMEDARAILDKRVEDLIFSFQDYVPAEMTKLENPVIVENGNVIVLVLADDADAAKTAADGLFA